MNTRLLLLIVTLPPTPSSLRVRVWRRFRALGAVPLKRTVYLLPDTPDHYEHFQWLAQEIQRAGADATLVRVERIENMTSADVIRLFQGARNPEDRAPAASRGPAGLGVADPAVHRSGGGVRVRRARRLPAGGDPVRHAGSRAQSRRRRLHVRDARQAPRDPGPASDPPGRDRPRGGSARRQVRTRGGARDRPGDPWVSRGRRGRPPGAQSRLRALRGSLRGREPKG